MLRQILSAPFHACKSGKEGRLTGDAVECCESGHDRPCESFDILIRTHPISGMWVGSRVLSEPVVSTHEIPLEEAINKYAKHMEEGGRNAPQRRGRSRL